MCLCCCACCAVCLTCDLWPAGYPTAQWTSCTRRCLLTSLRTPWMGPWSVTPTSAPRGKWWAVRPKHQCLHEEQVRWEEKRKFSDFDLNFPKFQLQICLIRPSALWSEVNDITGTGLPVTLLLFRGNPRSRAPQVLCRLPVCWKAGGHFPSHLTCSHTYLLFSG